LTAARTGFFDVVARQAAVFPDRPALVDGTTGRTTSAGAMVLDARRAAAHLHELGVGRGDRVGVLAQNRPQLVTLLLACARLGAVFVPFNTRLAAAEISALVSDAEPRAFVHDGHAPGLLAVLAAHLPPPERRILLGDAPEAGDATPWRHALSTSPPASGAGDAEPDDPFVICYTGGTTGTPKGAVLTHRSVLANAVNTITGWGLREYDVALVCTPLSHTGGLNVLLTPLMVMGGSSVIMRTFDPDAAFELIERHAVTLVFMVPAMFRMMMRRPRWASAAFSTVRHFVTGGAPCPRDVFEAFHAKHKPFRMGYGLTEAGPNNFHLDPALAPSKPGAVGHPLPFVDVGIDADGGGAAPGVVGELLVRGPHVFEGYWRRPEATARVLVDGWLHTGDLARRDDDGVVTVVGRRKEMFISGGENVYPAEVEEVLMRHPAVEDAAVVGVPSDRWGEVGLAAVVARPGRSPTAEELRDFCRERIARYKVPARVVLLGELPRTGAGKVDRGRIRGM
jgi:fatty-acyl-CoA synthase